MLGCRILQPNTLTPRCRLLRSQAVNRAVNPLSASVQHVSVNHRRAYIPMPEQFLNRTDVIAVFQ